MMAESVGSFLRQAREERKISLEEAAQSTHIRERFLAAIENDIHHELPSKVQGRGFLRIYADYLEIPSRPLLDLWEGKATTDLLLRPSSIDVNSERENQQDSSFSKLDPGKSTGQVDEIELSPGNNQDDASALIEKSEPDSKFIFNQIGLKLKQQRVGLNLNLTDVERYTHIKMHYLEAIETGNFIDLPSPVQGRGMLNNYALFLDMNADDLLLQFAEGLQTQRIERQHLPSGSKIGRKQDTKKFQTTWRKLLTPDLLFGSTVILLLLFVAIWGTAQITDLRKQEAEATAPSIVEVLLNTTATSEIPAETNGIPPPGSSDPVAEINALNDPLVPTNSPEDILLSADAINPNDPLQVYVVAHQRAWMRIISDEVLVFEGRVVTGNAYSFSGNQEIQLITGNGAALQVYFNQQDIGILGIVGQIIDMTFSQDGVITPTPAPSPSPTITPTPDTPAMDVELTATITPFIPE
jgi:cytoskeleton protein RodZ